MRPSWDTYFIEMLYQVRKRATCNRGRTSCIITRDNHILATGYVGSVAGAEHCDDSGHLMDDNSCIRTLHAEANAIAQCAKIGISVQGATIYCFLFPCLSCAKLLIQSGAVRIIAEYDYAKSQMSKEFFDAAGIDWRINCKKVYDYIDKD